MRPILLLLLTTLCLADLGERQLRKDYGVDYDSSSSGKSGKSTKSGKSSKSSGKSGKSSDKSSKSSGKSSKSSDDGNDLSSGDSNYGYDTYYDESSKSGKSGDAKASKYEEAWALDDVYDHGDGGSDNGHGSSGDGESSEDGSGNVYDYLADGGDDGSYSDDASFDDALAQNAFGVEDAAMSMSGSSSEEIDDSSEAEEAQSTEGDETVTDPDEDAESTATESGGESAGNVAGTEEASVGHSTDGNGAVSSEEDVDSSNGNSKPASNGSVGEGGPNSWLTDLFPWKGEEDESLSMMLSVDEVDAEENSEADIDGSMSMSLSMSVMSDDTPELEQSQIDFSEASLDGNKDDEESASDGVNAISNDIPIENIADDGISDDDIPELVQSQIDFGDYLLLEERSRIIREKCNMSPLGRALSLIHIIGNHVDPQDIISQSANSPQYLAFLWLVYIDDAILCPPPSQDGGATTFDGTDVDSTHEALDRIIQRYTLAMLYFSFDGHGWTNCKSERNFANTSLGGCVDDNGDELVRFLDSSHECAWFGVTCSTDVADMSAEHSPVTRLELQANNLWGSIPKDVGLLYTLEALDLRDNELTGTIPFGAFATMESLDTLILSGNKQLSGDANKYCETGSSLNDMLLFEMDCTPVIEELKPAPVQCSCCTACM